MSDIYEVDSYEVVLYETKDKTKWFVQEWIKGRNEPRYLRITAVQYKHFWRTETKKKYKCFGYNFKEFKQEMDIAIRKDTEKFPDLDKIAAYNKENGIIPYNDSN